MNRKESARGPSGPGKNPPGRPKPGAVGSRAGPSKEPAGGRQPAAGKTQGTCKGPATAGTRPPISKVKQPDKDAFPAFSIPIPSPSQRQQFKAKQKIIRRNKPVGEDLNKLREIVKSVRRKPTTVHEFVGLVAPSTGDNGGTMRTVLAEEMSLFQTTSRKIFETMTQDISDVLVNEQIQLKEYTLERHSLYEQKMQRALNEVLDHSPEFSFEQFFTNDEYLDEIFPLAELNIDQEELEALLRQEAYHRYHWLKSEGDRLKDENGRLQRRLRELKKRQKDELRAVTEKEQRAEDQRKLLEVTQEVLEERLEELNESVNKSLVQSELAQAEPISLQALPSSPKMTDKFKARSTARMKAAWASKQAAEIEATKASEDLHAESSMASVRAKPSKGKMGAKSRFKRPQPRPPPQTQQTPTQGPRSPFHYSPPRTPPTKEPPTKLSSPFHYSPPKTPPAASRMTDAPAGAAAEAHLSPKMNLSTSRVVTERQAPAEPGPSSRARGPRDTWGGFR